MAHSLARKESLQPTLAYFCIGLACMVWVFFPEAGFLLLAGSISLVFTENAKWHRSTRNFFLGFAVFCFLLCAAFVLPVIFLVTLTLCVLLAQAGHAFAKKSPAKGEFFVGLAFTIFAFMFPVVVLGVLLACLIVIFSGKVWAAGWSAAVRP